MTGVAVAQRQGGRHLSRWLLRCVKVFARATTGFSSTHPRWGVQCPPSTGGCFCKPPVSTIFYHGMVNLWGPGHRAQWDGRIANSKRWLGRVVDLCNLHTVADLANLGQTPTDRPHLHTRER